jgi:hypothetical protein
MGPPGFQQDYGLICKNKPKWGLILLALLGPDAHLIHLTGRFLSFRIDGKKHDNADGPSGPYDAAGSVVATMGTPPTKLTGNLA